MSEYIPSQIFFAEITGIDRASLSRNIKLLLRMVLKNGYTLNEKIAEKMNRETIKARKKRKFA